MTRRQLSSGQRRISLGGLAVVAVTLSAASVAWACTAQQEISGSTVDGQQSGPPGSPVEITVSRFSPGPVTIRWNSAGGPVMASGNGPNFTRTVTIPQVVRGVYYIVAVGKEQRAAMPFEVTVSPPGQSGAANPGATGDSAASSTGAAAPAAPAPSPGDAVTIENGRMVFGGSVGTAETGQSSGPGQSGSSAVAVPGGGRSNLGDLWGGFSSGPSASIDPNQAASAKGSGPSPQTIGVGMMSAGMVVLFLGFFVAERRRQRTPAHSVVPKD